MSVVQGLLLQCSMQWWLAGCEGVLCAGQTHLTRGCRQLLDLDMGMKRTDTYCTSDISSMLLGTALVQQEPCIVTMHHYILLQHGSLQKHLCQPC